MTRTPTKYPLSVVINGKQVRTVLIGRHYLIKHSSYMNDAIILGLVEALDGLTFPVDSTSKGIEYFAADILEETSKKIYRLVWFFENDRLEILGVVNAYRRHTRKAKES